MIGDLIVFGVVVIALGGGGIAAGILIGRRLERRLAESREADATGGADDELDTADTGLAPSADVTGEPGAGAPLVKEAR